MAILLVESIMAVRSILLIMIRKSMEGFQANPVAEITEAFLRLASLFEKDKKGQDGFDQVLGQDNILIGLVEAHSL